MINSPYSQLPFQSDWCQINPWQWAMTTRWSLILSQKGRSAIVSCLIQLKLAGLVIVWPSFPGCFLWGTVKKITKCLSIWKSHTYMFMTHCLWSKSHTYSDDPILPALALRIMGSISLKYKIVKQWVLVFWHRANNETLARTLNWDVASK